jgi:hypothetical protein
MCKGNRSNFDDGALTGFGTVVTRKSNFYLILNLRQGWNFVPKFSEKICRHLKVPGRGGVEIWGYPRQGGMEILMSKMNGVNCHGKERT